MPSSRAIPSFEEAWPRIAEIPGWLTLDQARELFRLAREGATDIVEIGSHQGRSTVTLALAVDGRVTAVDPFITARLFAGPSVRSLLLRNLAAAGVRERVDVVTTTSADAFLRWPSSRTVDLVYVDGKHDVASLLRDLRWAVHVRPGGYVVVHDAFSSVGVTVGMLLLLPVARRLALTHRVGSLAVLRVRPPTLRERLRIVIHLPWFTRNVMIKLLLRAGLTNVTARLGHTGIYDPY